MRGKLPHFVPYQGSKRLLAPQILGFMPRTFRRLVEPFAGSAAISVAVAQQRRTEQFVINDINAPLVMMLKEAVEHPQRLIDDYMALWQQQFELGEEHAQHFFDIRDRFNQGDTSPAVMLYLLARCVKGAIRYGRNGKFNQSPDKRRHGISPENLAPNVHAIAELLHGKATFLSLDYHEVLDMAQPGDLVYMDPPYQGVSNVRDHRYIAGVDFDDFSRHVELLDRRHIDYIISYDGECGTREYGQRLPSHLKCRKVMLNAGLSTQATLLGQRMTTFEALYISHSLGEKVTDKPAQLQLELV